LSSYNFCIHLAIFYAADALWYIYIYIEKSNMLCKTAFYRKLLICHLTLHTIFLCPADWCGYKWNEIMIHILKEVEFLENRMCLTKIYVNTTILGPQTEVPSDEGVTTPRICCHWQLCCYLPPFLTPMCWSPFNGTTLLTLSVMEKTDKNLWTYVSGRSMNISREMWGWFNKWDYFLWC